MCAKLAGAMQFIPLRRFVWVQLKTVHSVYRLVRKCPWFLPKEGGVSDLHSNLHGNYAAKPVAMALNLQRSECALPRRAKIKPAGFLRYSRSRAGAVKVSWEQCHSIAPVESRRGRRQIRALALAAALARTAALTIALARRCWRRAGCRARIRTRVRARIGARVRARAWSRRAGARNVAAAVR